MLRQASYTTVRMGVYNTVLEAYSKDGKQPNFAAKAGIGMLAGCIGSIFGNPAEVTIKFAHLSMLSLTNNIHRSL